MSAGPGAARVLRAGGSGVVEMRGYAHVGSDGWLHLADERAPRGPLTLTVAALPPVKPGWALVVTPTRVLLGAGEIDCSRARVAGSTGGLPRPASPCSDRALAAALAACPEPLAVLRPGLDALAAGDVDCGVDLLAGLGPGLTPAGDDVLAGYAYWRRMRVSERAAARASPLGLAYIRCAERGEVAEPVARALDAIGAGDAVAAARRARVLSTWGATTGVAMLWGAAAALEPPSVPQIVG